MPLIIQIKEYLFPRVIAYMDGYREDKKSVSKVEPKDKVGEWIEEQKEGDSTNRSY
jgi:hypothetical protein